MRFGNYTYWKIGKGKMWMAWHRFDSEIRDHFANEVMEEYGYVREM